MLGGASIIISPSWVPTTTIIDISWESNDLATMPVAQGPWWGDFALLGGLLNPQGQWDWRRPALELELWVFDPFISPPIRRLVAVLNDFDMPAMNGAAGMGSLAPTVAPVTSAVALDWRVAAPA